MIVFNADFPATCRECPIRAAIGCDLSYTKDGLLDKNIHPECPFEPADPVNKTVVAEYICLGCYHRFIGVKPEGCTLKKMVCPKCHKLGLIIETGEDTLAL